MAHEPDAPHIAASPDDPCFRWAMAASGGAMAIAGLDGHWSEINPALEQLLGYGREELVGCPIEQHLHPDDTMRVRAQTQELLAARVATVDTVQRYLHHNGQVIRIQVNTAVIRDPAGVATGLVMQLRDCNAADAGVARWQADMEQRALTLDTANRQLERFADAVSHDLRAPLRSIEQFSGLLDARLVDVIDETSRDHLTRVRNAAASMTTLLTALSELAYVTRAELNPVPVDLSLLADWVAAELQEAEPERQAEVNVQPGLIGYGDERLLKLLLGQLLGNAWKFSRGCPEVHIDVAGEANDDGLQLHVRDTGCGFDRRYAHKLFEPFQRLHGPEQGAGHGLGLAIAQRIAQRHQGQLSAESEPGDGSTFHLQLPAMRAA